MIYLDSSALVKRYIEEKGSAAVRARLAAGDRVFTSWLSYAEVLRTFVRKSRDGEIPFDEAALAEQQFLREWEKSIVALPLNWDTLAAVPQLLSNHSIKSADAVQLSSAFWLREKLRLGSDFLAGETRLEFGVADASLARIAAMRGLAVFNPEQIP